MTYAINISISTRLQSGIILWPCLYRFFFRDDTRQTLSTAHPPLLSIVCSRIDDLKLYTRTACDAIGEVDYYFSRGPHFKWKARPLP